jgi:hypothetical protein
LVGQRDNLLKLCGSEGWLNWYLNTLDPGFEINFLENILGFFLIKVFSDKLSKIINKLPGLQIFVSVFFDMALEELLEDFWSKKSFKIVQEGIPLLILYLAQDVVRVDPAKVWD